MTRPSHTKGKVDECVRRLRCARQTCSSASHRGGCADAAKTVVLFGNAPRSISRAAYTALEREELAHAHTLERVGIRAGGLLWRLRAQFKGEAAFWQIVEEERIGERESIARLMSQTANCGRGAGADVNQFTSCEAQPDRNAPGTEEYPR